MSDTSKMKFAPDMQGAREFIGRQVEMAVGVAVAETNRMWLASLPKCESAGCGRPATVTVGPLPRLRAQSSCDEHTRGLVPSETFPYAPIVRALMPKRAT